VHPDDAYARVHHASLGKTEAWLVIDADPDALGPDDVHVDDRGQVPDIGHHEVVEMRRR